MAQILRVGTRWDGADGNVTVDFAQSGTGKITCWSGADCDRRLVNFSFTGDIEPSESTSHFPKSSGDEEESFMRKFGIMLGLAAGAVLLTGCGGSNTPSAAVSAAPTTSAPADSAAPTDSTSAAPTSGGSSTTPQPSGTAYTGPTVGPNAKCGTTVTVVAGHIQCSHAEKVFQLYSTNKKADGKASFNGWTCRKSTTTTGVVCVKGTTKIHSTV